jgi:HEAT repeat protein
VQEIAAMLDALRIGDFQVRWDVAKQLEAYGEDVVSSLMKLLKESEHDFEIQWFIAKILGSLRHSDAVLPLSQLLESEDEDVRLMAAQGLAELGPKVIAQLSVCIKDPSRQMMALQALAQIQRPEVVPLLLEIAQTGLAPVRSLAFQALDQFNAPAIFDALLGALTDDSPEVRKTVIASLCVRTQHHSKTELVERLIPCLEDADVRVASQAGKALMRLGSDRGAIALIQKCCEPNLDLELQYALIQSLGWMESPVALEGLLKIWHRLAQQTPMPERLMQAILSGVAGCSEAEVWVHELMRSGTELSPVLWQSSTLRARAMLTLGRIGSPTLIPMLIERFEDPDYTVRLHVVAALKQIDPNLAHALMEQRLKDANSDLPIAQGLAIALQEW